MAILTFPDIVPESIDWRLTYSTQTYVSPFTGSTQTAELPGARWAARLNYTNLQISEYRELVAFLNSLRGMSGRFELYDFSLPRPALATSPPSPTTATGTPTETALELTSGVSGLSVGDYLEVTPLNSYKELKIITDITGSVITVEPPFRTTPLANDVVVLEKPRCIMMLDTDDQGGFSASTSISLANMSISCIEAF